jgi:hypothetical protein
MEEKRRNPRYPVRDVDGILHFNTQARILNLSLTGMAVETGTALRVGRAYSFTLRRGPAEPVKLSGEVAWCQLRRTRKNSSGDTAPVYEAGMRFDGMLSDRAHQLLHLLEESAIISVETRIAGRFKVADGEPIRMESEYDFLVTTVSASGMQIETEVAPELDAVYSLRFRLAGREVGADCRVANVRAVEGPDRRTAHLVGLEFTAMPAADRKTLEAFITGELKGALENSGGGGGGE